MGVGKVNLARSHFMYTLMRGLSRTGTQTSCYTSARFALYRKAAVAKHEQANFTWGVGAAYEYECQHDYE